MLIFDGRFSRDIEVPLDIPVREMECGAAAIDALTLLFPSRSAYFASSDCGRLVVDFRPQAPFGPEPGKLCDLLLPDLRAAALAVRDKFSLKGITLSGLEKDRRFSEKGITFAIGGRRSGKEGVKLDAVQFARLSSLCAGGKVRLGIVATVYLGERSVFSAYIPESSKIEDLFGHFPEVADFVRKNPGSVPYHPISGKELDPDGVLSSDGGCLVCFTGAGEIPAPGRGGLFPFPYFTRRIAMRRRRAFETGARPCSNCLACVGECPSGIHPSLLYHQIKAGNPYDARSMGLERCVSCGICSFVCPSGIGLHQTLTEAIASLESEE